MSLFHPLLTPPLKAILNHLSKRRLPPIAGDQRIQGLISDVEVVRDRWGVPHIYASNAWDLFFAQGYIHAQDRLFQMESPAAWRWGG